MANLFLIIANLCYVFALGQHWFKNPDSNYSLTEAIFFALLAIYYKKED